MPSKLMPEQAAINLFLTLDSMPNSQIRVISSFTAGLKDARRYTNRHPITGEKLPHNTSGDPGSWLGAVGYLIILDLIGGCFKPKYSELIQGNSIQKALGYFSKLSKLEIDAIYALRCAFSHDYSLTNINGKNPDLTHNFSVNQSPELILIKLPAQENRWTGDYNNKTTLNDTTINLVALGDLVESICTQVTNDGKQGKLEVVLPGGSDELIQRYSFLAKISIQTHSTQQPNR